MIKKGKNPCILFYPKDWREDNNLQACSMTSQGVFINLMCIMHSSDKYGYLEINNIPMDDDLISKRLGISKNDFIIAKTELKNYSVLRENEQGILYSKRMVEDYKIRQEYIKYGRLGGNPNIQNRVKGRVNPQKEIKDKPKDKAISVAVSSSLPSSISSTTSLKENYIKEVIDYLNLKTGCDYKYIESNIKFIKGRFNEGRTLEDFKKVIDSKCEQWEKDPKMVEFLRPKTLFNATNFESYVNQIKIKEPEEESTTNFVEPDNNPEGIKRYNEYQEHYRKIRREAGLPE